MKVFEHVFKPIKIGNLTAKNRIEVSPAEPKLATVDGYVTEEFIRYHANMAKGGAGIVTVGDSPINNEYAKHNNFCINLAAHEVGHGLFQLVEEIHRYGALANIELNLRDEEESVTDYSKEKIKQIIKEFADAAEVCKKAGFDMVMLHGGHGHVVANFYSPLMNKRTDEYGCGTFENRCRFANELIDAVRDRIGPEMAIEYRISGDELTVGGVDVEDALRFTKSIQHKIDLIHVSAGNLYNLASVRYIIQPTYFPMATNVRFAARFKEELDIPVLTVGSFNMELAEDAIATGKADMVAMIRAFIADPDIVNKARDGKADEIRPCVRCGACTGSSPHSDVTPLRCTVNPIAGREMAFNTIPKTEKSKKVLIVGGGCAGLEAARWLAIKGHRPIIIEKDPEIGGTLIEASACALKGDVKRYYEWSVRTIDKTPGIEVRLGTTATKELIEAEKPDALIIATGSRPIIPDIKGIDNKKVVLASDVDMGNVKVGKKVVVAGAGLTGTETAVALAQEGHEVTSIDMLTIEEIDAKGTAKRSVVSVLRKMAVEVGVKTIEKVRLVEINDEGAVIEEKDGNIKTLECDNVILSLGLAPNKETVSELEGLVRDTYIVGDCTGRPGSIASAVQGGFFAAMNIE